MTYFKSALPTARVEPVRAARTWTSTFALLRRYRREEDGSIILFSLFLFLLMILIGGMAVDLMRFETRRVHMQNTLDSALLAAANLGQTLDPEEVIRDYFEKAGYDSDAVAVSVDETRLGGVDLVGRSIQASTRVNVGTFFMHMLDVPVLSAPVAGSAIESIQNVEISLVLDISGSMRWGAVDNVTVANNRITDLRRAVLGFARSVLQVECTDINDPDTCVQPPTSSNTTINIIPYAGHVNPGRDMFEILGGSRWHNYSSCKEVTNADFNHANLPTASSQQLPHFMVWSIDWTWMDWGWCPKDSAAILYASNSYRDIHDYITDITLHDGTATHIGMKYGVALLNPTARPAFGQLADRGVIDNQYRNRPADFEDDVVKYIVLMTDGRTTDQFRPRVPIPGTTSLRNLNYGDIYSQFIPPGGGVSSNPSILLTGDGIAGGIPAGMSVSDNLGDILDRFGTVNRGLDLRPAAQVENGLSATSRYHDGSVEHNVSRNEQNILRACDQAKLPVLDSGGNTLRNHRMTVFTISFFAPPAAVTLMERCASTPSHHFRIQNLNIEAAFQAIAKTINQLRLTQ